MAFWEGVIIGALGLAMSIAGLGILAVAYDSVEERLIAWRNRRDIVLRLKREIVVLRTEIAELKEAQSDG